MSDKDKFIQQGWECPKCGAVMAPHVDVCVNCRGTGSNYVSVLGQPSYIGDIDWVKKQTSKGASYIVNVNAAPEGIPKKEAIEKHCSKYEYKDDCDGHCFNCEEYGPIKGCTRDEES